MTPRRSSPPTTMRPPVGSASRHSSDANVVLPEPVSPTMATLVPARDRDAHVDAAPAGRCGTRSRRARPPPGSAPGGQRGAARVVEDVDRDVEHVEHLAPARDRGLGLVDDLADLGDREEQQVHQERERDDRAEVEAELDAGERGDRDDRRERDGAEEVADREHQREVPTGLAVGEVELVHALVQPVARPVLEAVGAHRRRAGDRLGELGEHVAGARAHLVVRDELAPLQEAQDRDDGQERHDRDEGELPRVDRHHDERPDDERAVHHPADRTPVHEPGEGLDVARHARDEHAPLGLVLLGHAQPVDVLEHPHPERVERALGRPHEPEVGEAREHHQHDRRRRPRPTQAHDHEGAAKPSRAARPCRAPAGSRPGSAACRPRPRPRTGG